MVSSESLLIAKSEIDKMIEDRRATRLINPVLVLFYLKEFQRTGSRVVNFNLVKQGYEDTVCDLIRSQLHHNFNIGGQFNDSYLQRLASRHRVLDPIKGKDFAISAFFAEEAQSLIPYTASRIVEHLENKLLDIIKLHKMVRSGTRDAVQEILSDFTSKKLRELLQNGFESSSAGFLNVAYGFEICMFAILKILLAKFGCKIYRDSKTYSSDKGTDLGTNFGVVYQVKKRCITTEEAFNKLVSELLLNFADGRIQEGNVFIIIEDIDDGFRMRLESKHINCITQKSVTAFLDKLNADEKWEILKQIDREFERELASDICYACKKPERQNCPYSPLTI